MRGPRPPSPASIGIGRYRSPLTTAMRRSLLVLVSMLAAAILVLRLPQALVPHDVDSSWQELLQLDWNRRARCGIETLFTYGPAGFLLGTGIVSTVEGARDRYLAAIAWAVIVAAALIGLVGRMPTSGWRRTYVVAVLFVAPMSYGSDAFLVVAALGTVTLLRLGGADRPPSMARLGLLDVTLLIVTCVVFALAGTTKFTHLLHATALITLTFLTLLVRGSPGRGMLVLATFVLAVLAVWTGLGQRLGDLPAYLRGSWEIAEGYQGAQALDGPTQDLVFAGIVIGLNLLLAASCIFTARTLPRIAAVTIGIATLFFAWKAAFVRHDLGHAIIFSGVAALVPFLMLAAAGRVPGQPWRLIAAAAVVIGIGQNIYVRERIGVGLLSLPAAAHHNLTLLRPRVFDAYVAAMLAPERLHRSLPGTRAVVGDEPIDLIGCEQGYLVENGLNVHHRPLFQSYSVFTPYLQRLNGAFYAGDHAPRYVLAQVKPIDGHFPLAEDSTAWKVLLDRYYPVGAEKGLLLLERLVPPPTPTPATPIVERRAALGEWVEVPANEAWHELSLDVAYSTRGKLVGFAFRPADLCLEVRSGDIASRFEIAPLMVQESFLLDPLIQSEADLLAGYLGEPLPRVTAFRVVAAKGAAASHFEPSHGLRLLRRQPPAAPDAERAARARAFLTSLRFPTFTLLPERVEPEGQTKAYVDGSEAWVLAHAPCALHFAWPGGRHVLAAEFRIDPGAYDHDGDGAVFRVEVGAAPRRVVFERRLDPGNRPEDRGAQPLRVELDLPAAEPVVLLTDPGAPGNSSYDWTSWRRVRVEAR